MLCAFALAAALSGSPAPPPPLDDAALAAEIDRMLEAAYPKGEPGAAAIVVRDGRTVLRKGYGLANVELGVPIAPEMVFRIGSVTKQFTAAAVMQLVEAGKVALDDPLTKFLPDYPVRGHLVTVEHLLTHTSGIHSYTSMPEFWQTQALDSSLDELITVFKNEPFDFDPGEKWLYNNSGYVLLGAIVEKASGMKYADYMAQHVFEPLGLKHTTYGSVEPILPGRVEGYEKEGETLKNARYLGMSKPFSAGALVSNVDDLAAWNTALEAGRVVSRASLDRMQTPYRLKDGSDTGYGYGLSLYDEQGSHVVTHGGGINGFLCSALRLPADRVFVAVLTNRGYGAGPDDLSRRIAALATGHPFVDPQAVVVPEAVLERYVGVYRIDEKQTRTISREGTRLFSQRSGGERNEILPESETRFFFKDDRGRPTLARLEFVTDAGGRVLEVQMRDGPEHDRAPRTDEKAKQRTEIALPESALAPLVGRYELVPGFVLAITLENGQLMSQATGQGRVPLFAESETEFFLKVVDAQITFVRDATGAATSLVLHQGGQDVPGRRLPD
jgi:D-alanyl-D-alanine carboxypeptidase